MLTQNMLKQFNLKREEFRTMDTIDQLVSQSPLMISAIAVKSFEVNLFTKKRKIKKGEILVLSLRFFQDLQKNKKTKQILLKPYKVPFNVLFKRYRGQSLDNKRLLISRGGGLGDLIFIQPILKYLKEKYPTCKISLASHPRFLSISNYFPNGLIDRQIEMPLTTRNIYNHNFHLLFEGSIERCREAERVNAYDIFAQVAGLDIDHQDNRYRPTLIPNNSLIENIKLPENFIVFQSRASSKLRSLSPNKTSEIARRINELGYTIVYLDRPDHELYYDVIIKQKKLDPKMNINLSSKCKDIGFTIAVINKSKGVVGIDSVYNHISNALGKKTLAIFGPFKADLRLRYYKQRDWIEPSSKEQCGCDKFPCFYHEPQIKNCQSYQNGFPPRCMESIDIDELIIKFKNLFSGEKQ